MQILIFLLFAIGFNILILKWDFFKKCRLKPKVFCFIFSVKLLFGIGFYLVYTVHYSDNQTSDMHKYFNDANKIFQLTKNEPSNYFSVLTGIEFNNKSEIITQQLSFWYQEESASVINDSRMVIRFNLLLLPLSRGNIYIHLIIVVFLSFIGLFLIFLCFEKYFIQKEILLLIACFGIPSVMFWSSGIMKEGILIFFIGVFIHNLFKYSTIKLSTLLIGLISFIGIFYSKFYVALSMLPSLMFLFTIGIFKQKTITYNLFLTIFLCLFCAYSFNTLLNNLPLQKLSKKQNDFINLSIGGIYLVNTNSPFDTIFTLHKNSYISSNSEVNTSIVKLKDGTIYHHWKNPGYSDTLIAKNNRNQYLVIKELVPTGSAISLKRLMPNYKSVFALFPEAFINVFFRPFIFDIENILSFLACTENIAIVILILIVLYHFKPHEKSIQKIIVFSCLFVFTLYTLVGLTTPVLGAAVRYKVPAIPFLILSLFLIYDFGITKFKNFEKIMASK